MIFDELWRAERRARKKAKKIHEKYTPLLEAARKEGEDKYENILAAFRFEQESNDEPDRIRAKNVEKQARRLGIPIPSMPTSYDPAHWEANDNWILKPMTHYPVLTDKAELALVREIRREKDERLQHRMRWVIYVIIPVTGLIGTLMGLISLLHSLGLIG